LREGRAAGGEERWEERRRLGKEWIWISGVTSLALQKVMPETLTRQRSALLVPNAI
jgi:hypothetical protein